jgi:hypothetical protein
LILSIETDYSFCIIISPVDGMKTMTLMVQNGRKKIKITENCEWGADAK